MDLMRIKKLNLYRYACVYTKCMLNVWGEIHDDDFSDAYAMASPTLTKQWARLKSVCVWICSKAVNVCMELKIQKNAHRIQPFGERDGTHHMPMAMQAKRTGWHDVWYTQTHGRTHTNTHTPAADTKTHHWLCALAYVLERALPPHNYHLRVWL